MEMGDYEVGIVYLEIKRHRSYKNARQSAHYEDEKEAESKQHRRLEHDPASPHGGEPAENLCAAGNYNHETGGGEKALAHLREARGKHVVYPQPEANKTRSHHG